MENTNFESERINGNAHFKKQEYDRALEIYMETCTKAEKAKLDTEKHKGLNSSMLDTINKQLSLLYFNVAVSYTKLGFLKDAMVFIDKAILLESTDKFLARKALVYLKEGKCRPALEICSRISNKDECRAIKPPRCPELETLLDSFVQKNIGVVVFNPPYVETDSLGHGGIAASYEGGCNGRVVIDRLVQCLMVPVLSLLLTRKNMPQTVVANLGKRGYKAEIVKMRLILGEFLVVIKAVKLGQEADRSNI